MTPVLEERAGAGAAVRRVFEMLRRIRAMTAEERHVVRTGEHIDRVDLQDAEAIDGPEQRRARRRAATGRVETLRSEGN